MRTLARQVRAKSRWALFFTVLAIMFAVSPAAGAAVIPQAGPVAAKACAPAPEPIEPASGLPGKLYPEPASAVDGDPFAADSALTIADVYGYSYRWVDFDNGCLPGGKQVAGMNTNVGNFFLSWASSINALTHSEFTFVITPDWLGGFDDALVRTTQAVQRGFFGPWFTPVMLLVACTVLWAASRADIATAITSAGWAVLVLVATTYVMSYPVASANAIDGVVQTAVTTAARGTITPPIPLRPDVVVPDTDLDSPWDSLLAGDQPVQVSAAQGAFNQQMDIINRNTLYAAWLEGTLGSSTSVTATKYGPDLFKASHLSWSQYATTQSDPGAGKDIIAAKKDLWEQTAAKVHEADAGAYQQLTGNEGRAEAAFTAWVNVGATMPFLGIAGVLIVVAYGATRAAIPLVPALGVFGMFRPLQGWLMGVLGKFAKIIASGPIFFAGALVNLMIVTAVFQSGLNYALKLVMTAMVPIILFAILKPNKNGGLGKIGRMARGMAMRSLKHGNGGGGQDGGNGESNGRKPAPTSHEEDGSSPTPSNAPVHAPRTLDTEPVVDEPAPILEHRPSGPVKRPVPGRRRDAGSLCRHCGAKTNPGFSVCPSCRREHEPRKNDAVPVPATRRLHEPVTPDDYAPRRPDPRVPVAPSTMPDGDVDLTAPAHDPRPLRSPGDEAPVLTDGDGAGRFVPWLPSKRPHDPFEYPDDKTSDRRRVKVGV